MNAEKISTIDEAVEKLNFELAENTEQKVLIVYDPLTINYKKEILDGYKGSFDPFGKEIGASTFDYEQNPAEPTKPTKTVELSKFVPLF